MASRILALFVLIIVGCAGCASYRDLNVRPDVRLLKGVERPASLSADAPVTIVIKKNAAGNLAIPGPTRNATEDRNHLWVAFVSIDWEDWQSGQITSMPLAVADKARGIARHLGCDELLLGEPLTIVPSDSIFHARRPTITFVAISSKMKFQPFKGFE